MRLPEPHKVYFRHIRNFVGDGVATVAAMKTDDKHVFVGVSVCSDKDQFSKRLGREVAEKRMRLTVQTLGGMRGYPIDVVVAYPKVNRSWAVKASSNVTMEIIRDNLSQSRPLNVLATGV